MNEVKEIVFQMFDKLTLLEQAIRMSCSNVSNTVREDIIIVAGYCDGTVERFSWKDNIWVKMASLNHLRVNVCSFIFGDELRVVGATGTMEVLNFKTEPAEWKLSVNNPHVLNCREGHCTLVYRNRVILIGGLYEQFCFHDGGIELSVVIVPVAEISEVLFTPPYARKVLGRMPEPRMCVAAELFENRILIFGGKKGRDDKGTDSVFEFDLIKNECKTLSSLPQAISEMASVRWGDKVVLIGGRNKDAEVLRQVLMYDSASEKIDVLPSMLEARVSPCAVITGNMIVVMGGRDAKRRLLTSVEGFVLGGYSWEYLPSLNVGRSGATAALVPAKFSKSW